MNQEIFDQKKKQRFYRLCQGVVSSKMREALKKLHERQS